MVFLSRLQTKYASAFALMFAGINGIKQYALGAVPDNSLDGSNMNSGDFSGGFIGSLLTVFIVLLIIIGLIFLLVRFLASRTRNGLSGKGLRLLGGLVLGQNKSVQIVQLGEKVYIIGVGDDVRLIEKVKDPLEVTELMEALEGGYTAKGNQPFPSLLDWIKKISGRYIPEQEPEAENESRSFQEIFQDKFKHASNRSRRVQQMLQEDTMKDRSNEE